MTAALGVNPSWLFSGVFFVGAMLAGLAGALQLPREPANLNMDLTIIADVFVVTVVGGLGSIRGAFVAALIIGIVRALCIGIGDVAMFGSVVSFAKLTLVAEFVVMAIVLIARPWGLYGQPQPPSADRRAARSAVAAGTTLRAGRGRFCSRRSRPRRSSPTTTRWCSAPTC